MQNFVAFSEYLWTFFEHSLDARARFVKKKIVLWKIMELTSKWTLSASRHSSNLLSLKIRDVRTFRHLVRHSKKSARHNIALSCGKYLRIFATVRSSAISWIAFAAHCLVSSISTYNCEVTTQPQDFIWLPNISQI